VSCVLRYSEQDMLVFFVTSQHTMRAERDIVLANPSVCQSACLSVRHAVVLYLNECTYG